MKQVLPGTLCLLVFVLSLLLSQAALANQGKLSPLFNSKEFSITASAQLPVNADLCNDKIPSLRAMGGGGLGFGEQLIKIK